MMADFKQNKRRADIYRKLMAENLGRILKKDEIVHHINGDFTDNRLENLIVMTSKDHRSMHALEQGFGRDRTNSKLTLKQIGDIVMSGKRRASLVSQEYGVSVETIYYIWRSYGRIGKCDRIPTKCRHDKGSYLDKYLRKRCKLCKRFLKK